MIQEPSFHEPTQVVPVVTQRQPDELEEWTQGLRPERTPEFMERVQEAADRVVERHGELLERLAVGPQEHAGATEEWSPKEELDEVAPVGHLDPEGRELHEALASVERNLRQGLNDLFKVTVAALGLSPAEELTLLGMT